MAPIPPECPYVGWYNIKAQASGVVMDQYFAYIDYDQGGLFILYYMPAIENPTYLPIVNSD